MLGVSLEEYEEMTPRQLILRARAYQELKKAEAEEYQIKYENERKLLTLQAYLISRWVWVKNLDIKKILNEMDDKSNKTMTDEEMLAQAKALNVLFGGEVKEIGTEK